MAKNGDYRDVQEKYTCPGCGSGVSRTVREYRDGAKAIVEDRHDKPEGGECDRAVPVRVSGARETIKAPEEPTRAMGDLDPPWLDY